MKSLFQLRISAIGFFFLMMIFSCKKEDTIPENNSGGGNPFGNSILLNISGQVLDDATGNPVAGAVVKAGSASVTSDNNGIFLLKNAPGNSSLGLVQVEKAGYFSGSRSFLPVSGGGNLQIRLMAKNLTGTTSTSGGTISHSSGAELMLEPGSITKNGTAYTGNVKVYLQNIDPTITNFESRMPGNLVAMDGNAFRGLKSFGMLAAELQDDAGNELQIAAGKKAHIKFPIPALLQTQAADSIDLWYYDEAKGYWKKEGRAGKEGNFYHAMVSHFSFWNCDVPYNFIELKGRILSAGQPLAGARVSISSAGMGSRSDISNTEGRFGGFVPKDEILSLKVEAACGGAFSQVYSGNIGLFATNTSISDISVTLPNARQITGKITGCNNATLSGAYVVADGQAYFADASGNYSFLACGSSLTLTAFGSNPWAQGSSQTIDLTGTNTPVNLQVCSGGGIGGTITDIDGNVYNTVPIGIQVWMKENLKTSKYRNGEPITTNLSDTAWEFTTAGAYSVYDNNPQNDTIYGKIYNWYAVADPRGLCPTGWHLPSDAEWRTLENFLGGTSVAGGKMKSTGTIEDGTGLWLSPNYATNSSGFTGLPGGARFTNGTYNYIGEFPSWWSSTEPSSTLAWGRSLDHNASGSFRYYFYKSHGVSVRCLRD